MSDPTLSRAQARAVDHRASQEYGLPGVVLMENAGRSVAEFITSLNPQGKVLIACGPGNNGGDGFVIARHLELRGLAVQVLAWVKPRSLAEQALEQIPQSDAEANLRVLEAAGTPLALLDPADNDGALAEGGRFQAELRAASLIVDALLGTGSHGEPQPPLDKVIDLLNASGIPIVSVDVPSGLDCDTGEPSQHTIRAQHTCAFVAVKTGFLAEVAAPFLGQVHVLDIGAPRKLIEEVLRHTESRPQFHDAE